MFNLRHITAECSSPQVIESTGSLRMKKCDATLSANLLRPIVNTAPVSKKSCKGFSNQKQVYTK